MACQGAKDKAEFGYSEKYGIIQVILEKWRRILKKSYRVKKEQDFSAIFKNGESSANRRFVIYKLKNSQGHFRLGLSVSKKLGNAVVRNKIKRRIRSVIQTEREKLDQDYDMVIIARKGVESLNYDDFMSNLCHALKVAKLYQEGLKSEKEV